MADRLLGDVLAIRRALGQAVTASRRRRSGPGRARRRPGRARAGSCLLDVDGVLTDGRLYYGPEGEAMKAFDVKDGHGIVLVRDHVDFGVISRPPRARRPRVRLEELRFKHLVFGERDKLEGYARLAHLGVPDEAVAYMGDDVNDVALLRRVGLAGRARRRATRGARGVAPRHRPPPAAAARSASSATCSSPPKASRL